MRNYYTDISVADLKIRLETEQELQVTEAFLPFVLEEDESETPHYTVKFHAVKKLEIPAGKRVYEEGRFFVLRLNDGSLLRGFRKETDGRETYAISIYESGNYQIQIIYLETARKEFEDTQKIFLHIGLEWMLMSRQGLMLHASCVKTPLGGLLFSGPSGIGKSTQADLWCRYGDGKLINGDKTILFQKENHWDGYGSPYAGSSGCYVNEKTPIRIVLFLSQGERCSLKRLSMTEGFKRLYTSMTVNQWDFEYVETVSRLAAFMAEEVPMYEFICTPDLQAVDYIKRILLEGEVGDE